MIVRDCLGRERAPSYVWPDGSYNCPFCCAAVEPSKAPCPNPACWARGGEGMPPYPAERARVELEVQEQRKREQAERDELDRWRRERADGERLERDAWWADTLTEARRRDACVACAAKRSDPYQRKPVFVRHRKACPLDRDH